MEGVEHKHVKDMGVCVQFRMQAAQHGHMKCVSTHAAWQSRSDDADHMVHATPKQLMSESRLKVTGACLAIDSWPAHALRSSLSLLLGATVYAHPASLVTEESKPYQPWQALMLG